MTRARFTACGVWLLGVAVGITGFYCGLDHWGRFFPKHLNQRAQMPLDVVAEVPLSNPAAASHTSRRPTSVTSPGASWICALCVRVSPDGRDDDYTGDEPDEPVHDRLTIWLCDDGGGQKQFGLAVSAGDHPWWALALDPSDRLPSDEGIPSALSLNSLHVRLQI